MTLWLAAKPGPINDELTSGANVLSMSAPGSAVIAVDGESQVSAWRELYNKSRTTAWT